LYSPFQLFHVCPQTPPLLTLPDYSLRFIGGVVEEGGALKLVAAIKSLKRILRAYRDEHSAILTTARPLAEHEVQFYSSLFAQQYLGGEAKLEMTTLVDPSILGGYKLSIDDGEQVVDRSYATELAGIDTLEENVLRSHFTVDRRVLPRSL
jgi:F0F1-type ATP synthase delta subunit